jgi:hypothetical protein
MTGIKWTETGGPCAAGNGADEINERIDHADAIPTDSPDSGIQSDAGEPGGELPALGRHTLTGRGCIAVPKELEAAVQNIPDRWLFDERELAIALKQKHPLVYPDYVSALEDWVAARSSHYREMLPGVLAGLDRDRGCYSSPFFHFTSSDGILSLDGRTIRQSRLRFWVPAHSCLFMNPVGCAFVRALRPDLDPIVVESETHSLVVTAEGFVDLNVQALGEPPSEARAELFKAKQ